MFLPPAGDRENKKVQILKFKGLDLRAKAAGNTLSYTENISSDAYPALTPAKGRRKAASGQGISAVVSPEYTDEILNSFTGVMNGKFYYCGKQITGSLVGGEKSIADFNGKLCIFPDKMYYDYLPSPGTGKVSSELKSMEKILTAGGVRFYGSYDSISGAYEAYLQKSGAGFDRFSEGESVIISGCGEKANNTCLLQSRKDFASDADIVSAVVKASSGNRLDLLLYTKSGSKAVFKNMTEQGTVTVKASIPDMNHVCVHNNRLWGTAANGEYLYASKLGDCFNFNSFQGLGDDSWYSRIGTPGTFTGICSYRTAVVAFKRDCMHHVYGDAPQNFSIPKQTISGCVDGRSIAELGGILYYLSSAGFCGYSGGEPYKAAPQITADYISCAAGSDGKKYYAAAYKKDGSCDVLVFDPELDLWYREDDTPFIGFARYGGRLYGAENGGVWELNAHETPSDWSFTTNRLTYDVFEHKGVNCMWLRLDTEKGSKVTVSISFDSEDFVKCAEVTGSGFKSHRIPVRFKKCDSFRIRLTGSGKAVIHDLEIVTHQGGRTYAI